MLKKENRRLYYVFSPFLRLFHWIAVVCILTLFITGLFITHPVAVSAVEPDGTNLTMNLIRNIHLGAGFIFTGTMILRVYGFIINKGDRLMPRVWEGHFYRECVDVAMHYGFMKYEHAPYLRNPLARCSYAGFYAFFVVIILTGFSIYFMDTDTIFGHAIAYVNTFCGDIMMARYVHHYVAWLIIFNVIGHMYMVFRADYMDAEGEISSMVSGYKDYRHRPLDVEELGEEAHTAEYWAAHPKK